VRWTSRRARQRKTPCAFGAAGPARYRAPPRLYPAPWVLCRTRARRPVSPNMRRHTVPLQITTVRGPIQRAHRHSGERAQAVARDAIRLRLREASRLAAMRRTTYTEYMQLQIARLCLDCDEVHSAEHCPVCASEAFAYLTRWVPAPERRMQPRPTTSPAADVYRELTSPNLAAPRRGRLLTRSTLGVAAIAVAGWIWRWNKDRKKEQRGTATGHSPEPVVNGERDQTPANPQ